MVIERADGGLDGGGLPLRAVAAFQFAHVGADIVHPLVHLEPAEIVAKQVPPGGQQRGVVGIINVIGPALQTVDVQGQATFGLQIPEVAALCGNGIELIFFGDRDGLANADAGVFVDQSSFFIALPDARQVPVEEGEHSIFSVRFFAFPRLYDSIVPVGTVWKNRHFFFVSCSFEQNFPTLPAGRTERGTGLYFTPSVWMVL